MTKGILITWKEDRGFGFIKPVDGGRDIFIHISAIKDASRRPITGDVMYYQVAKDNRGKYKAVNVQIEGLDKNNNNTNDKTPGFSKKILIAATLGLLVVAGLFFYLR